MKNTDSERVLKASDILVPFLFGFAQKLHSILKSYILHGFHTNIISIVGEKIRIVWGCAGNERLDYSFSDYSNLGGQLH